VDTDLSGRAAAKILPDLLPLVPRLLSDGGTLRAETTLTQAQGEPWQGEAQFLAEARRTSMTLPSGRFAAGRAAVEGRVEIRDEALGDVRAEVVIEDGMYSSQGNSARMNFRMGLDVPPPYQEAKGMFVGKVNANNWMAKSGVRLADTNGVAFGGEAVLKDMLSAPEWRVKLDVPSFGVMSVSNEWSSVVGVRADVRYSMTNETVEALGVSLWADGSQWVSADATARVERVSVGITMPPFKADEVSNAVAQVTAEVSGGWCRAGGVFEAEGVRLNVPFTWSMAESVAFPHAPGLTWERMALDGLGIEPTGFALANEGGVLAVRTGIRCKGSALNIQTSALVPLEAPDQLTVGVSVPDMVLEPDDSLAAWMRKMDEEMRITGNLAVRADLRLLGSQPYVVGQVDVSDGRVKRGAVDISGITVCVPFEAGVEQRTVGRPFAAFKAMNVGDVRLTDGRVEFQVTPAEVFISRMEAGFGKGKVYTYSIHLDPLNPNAEVTMYADRIDLGELLMDALPFKADKVEGVLFGRFPVAVEDGHIRLKPGFLYSLPGQGGAFRVDDSRVLEPWLAQAGIQSDVNAPLAKALSNMDFSVIRVELETNEDDDEAVLRFGLKGKSNSKDWPAPVDLNLNLRGPLEAVLNMGLKLSQQKGEMK